MKIILALLATCILASAQTDTNAPPPPPNYAVQFWGVNADGYPRYYPSRIESIGTNAVLYAPWVLFSEAQLGNLIATNLAAFRVAKSNAQYSARVSVDANVGALITSFSNLQWCADNWASVTNLNTLKIAVKAEGDVLLKLKPVLRQMYDGKQ